MNKILNLLRVTTFTTMPGGRKLRKGDQIKLEYRIENNSNSDIRDICINQEGKIAEMAGISISPGYSQTISIAYLLTMEDERTRIIRNTAILSYRITTGEIITETLTGLNIID